LEYDCQYPAFAALDLQGTLGGRLFSAAFVIL